jgi:hypothetical protein
VDLNHRPLSYEPERRARTTRRHFGGILGSLELQTFDLFRWSEQFEDYRMTKAYYEKAMSVSRELGGPHAGETVRGVERILELLPAYYADREHRVIVRENLGGRARRRCRVARTKGAPAPRERKAK